MLDTNPVVLLTPKFRHHVLPCSPLMLQSELLKSAGWIQMRMSRWLSLPTIMVHMESICSLNKPKIWQTNCQAILKFFVKQEAAGKSGLGIDVADVFWFGTAVLECPEEIPLRKEGKVFVLKWLSLPQRGWSEAISSECGRADLSGARIGRWWPCHEVGRWGHGLWWWQQWHQQQLKWSGLSLWVFASFNCLCTTGIRAMSLQCLRDFHHVSFVTCPHSKLCSAA